MTRLCSIVCMAVGLVPPAFAQDGDSKPPADAHVVKPFVGETTFLIVKVDPGRINPPAAVKALDATPDAKAAFDNAMETLAVALAQLQSLADGQPLFATVGVPISSTRNPVFCFRRKTSDKNLENVRAFVKDRFRGQVHVHVDYIVATPRGGNAPATSAPPDAALEKIAAAFKAVADYPVQLLIVPPDYVWRTVRELSPELPRQLGGGPSRVLIDGVQWVGVGIELERLRVEVVIQSASGEAARAFAAHLPAMLQSAYQAATPAHLRIPAKLAKALIDSLEPQVEGSQVKVRVDGFEKNSANLTLLAGIARAIGERRRRHSHQQRFRQILIAMHNYHDRHQSFPPADKHRDKAGKHGLSWRVHLLPYVGQQELYNQFHLDEPWDSPHNKKLLEKMPDVYARNSTGPFQPKLKPGHTTFLAPAGKQTIFGGAKAARFSQITDGLSNTVALLEVKPENAVPWTSPADYSFNPQNPLTGVFVGGDKTWLAGFADGSLRHLREDIPRQTMLFLFQMNDGNAVKVD